MVTFTATSASGGTVVGMGVSDGNLERLRAGKPLTLKLASLGFQGAVGSLEILIFWGETEADLADTVAPMIGPQTVLRPVPDGKP